MKNTKELKERWKLPMDKFWRKFQMVCIALAVVVPTTGELGEYYAFFPEGFIPQWIKTLVGMMITLGILIPKFTVLNKDELEKKLEK